MGVKTNIKKILRKLQAECEIATNPTIKIEKFCIEVSRGEELVIIVNGPSLKESLSDEKTLEFIRSRKKICVNSSFLDERIYELRPDFLVLMDPYYWSENLVGLQRDLCYELNEVLSKIDWSVTIFMPKSAKKWNFFIDVPQKNENIKIVYINSSESKFKDEKTRFFEYKKNWAMPKVQNVLVACIYLGINLGFLKTYLFGADHSWHENIHVTKDNVPCIKDMHFYDEDNIEIVPFYKDPECTNIFTMADLFEAFMFQFRSYEELEKYAQELGIKIYNASHYSCLDVFERFNV